MIPVHQSHRPALVTLLAIGGFSVACGAAYEADQVTSSAPDDGFFMEAEEQAMGGAGSAPPPPAPKRSGNRDISRKMAKKAPRSPAPASAAFATDGAPEEPEPEMAMQDAEGAKGDGDEGESAPTRAWFPETFLFEPEVVTNASGTAVVYATVPDRLTSWRVLALAHDRKGHQAGDVVSFTSSLPLYADPVIPAQLRVGDRVRLAVPVINTTDAPRSVAVTVAAEDLDVRGGGSLAVPELGSAVARAELAATKPGTATLRAEVRSGDTTEDAVVHSIPVIPTGQRHATVTTGTLGAPRTIDLPLPPNADPESAEARITLVPGGLGIVQAEVAQVQARARGAEGAALVLSVASVAPKLWKQAGIPVSSSGEDPEASARHDHIRKLRLLGVQQALRLDSRWSLEATLALTNAAAGHPDDPVLARLTDRGLGSLAEQQRPDGTFGGDSSGTWTVQRMLVATALAVDAAEHAAGADPELADTRGRQVAPLKLRSQGAAERYAGRVTDAYTASALLAAGLVEGETRDRFAALIRESLKPTDQGLRVELPQGVVRVDGRAPSPVATAALAARALATLGDDADTTRIADLGSTVLAAFRPGRGFGDPATDLTCLRAVADLWATPPGQNVVLTLSRGDDVRLTRSLTAEDLRNPVFAAVSAAGTGPWMLEVDPPVPGLAYSLESVAWTPWTNPPKDAGIEVEVQTPKNFALGTTRELVVELASHRGTRFEVEVELPAGVKVTADDIQVEGAASVEDVESRDGVVVVRLPGLTKSSARLRIPVSPTVAGTLWSGSIAVTDRQTGAQTVVPPVAWQVGGGA
jgi:hypothetical protein